MNKVMMSYLVFFVEFLGVKVCEGMVGGGGFISVFGGRKKIFRRLVGYWILLFF